jgi:hypothetical protein
MCCAVWIKTILRRQLLYVFNVHFSEDLLTLYEDLLTLYYETIALLQAGMSGDYSRPGAAGNATA